MDNVRVFLWVGLGLLLWIAAQTWEADYGTRVPVQPVATDDAPAAPDDTLPELPVGIAMEEPGDLPGDEVLAAPPVELISVVTDVLDLRIDPVGGKIVAATLLNYPVRKDDPDNLVQLMRTDPAYLYTLESGVRAADERPEAGPKTPFTSVSTEFKLTPGNDVLEVPLSWAGDDGIGVQKIFRFERGSYAIGLEQRVTNASATPYRAAPYQQIRRRHRPPERSMFDVDSYSFNGPVVYDGDKYDKLDVGDLRDEPLVQTVAGGWIASIEHHFLTAAIPSPEFEARYQVSSDGDTYIASSIATPLTTIEPNSTQSFNLQFFVGPKLQEQLEATADGLALTVDYGMLTILAQPLFWILKQVQSVVVNWGLTIILVTLLIKLVFYKLTETAGRSMAQMRKLQPRLKALQERYKDDREALSRAMMDLYKTEKINPLAGCLPMLIQIPFFIAFYWVLLESVEMRQAPFALWITDLSTRDPFFILPLLMGAAMWFQQKLNPAPPDPVQAKVMQFLPVIFTGMFAFFPSGLVLYWLTNSVLSIAQQWRINKVVGAD